MREFIYSWLQVKIRLSQYTKPLTRFGDTYLVSTTSPIHPSNSKWLTLASSLETLCWLAYTVLLPQASQSFLSSLAHSLPLWALMRQIVSWYLVTSTCQAPSNEIDDNLADLLNSTGITQHISSLTRHDSNHTKSSLLDLIITPSTSSFISTTSVVSSHEISDHDLALANLTTKRYKSPQRTYQYRDIKNIDLDLFKQNMLSSSLFSNPNPTADGYADQMETAITSLWDTAAPLKTGHRSGPRRQKNGFHLMRLKPRSGDGGSSVVGRLPSWIRPPHLPRCVLICKQADKQVTRSIQYSIHQWGFQKSQTPLVNHQVSSPFVPVNNPPYHNHWQIPLLLSFIKRLSPSKSRSLWNYSVTPHLLILISHTVTSCFQNSCLSPQLRFQTTPVNV